jgi:glycosyltransferase involved in cell wall biosynthesis
MLLRGLDLERFDPQVLFVYDSPVVELFRSEGFSVCIGPGYGNLNHTTGHWNRWRHFPLMAREVQGAMRLVKGGVAQRLFDKNKPDLIHLNSLSLVPWAVAAKRAAIPVICHVRESIHPGYFGIRRHILTRLLVDHADAIINICDYDRLQLGNPPQSRVIHNFVDFTLFSRFQESEPVRAELAIPSEKIAVLYVGGINRIKGAIHVAQAAHIVQRYNPNGIYWVVAGVGASESAVLSSPVSAHGRYQRAYWRFVDRHNLAPVMRHIGVRTDIHRIMAAADVVVFPSLEPHFARPLMEAGAMARVGIGSDLGGPREIIVDGETGYLVRPGDPEALAQGLLTLVHDAELRQRFGEAAYKRAQRMFEAKRNTAQTVRLYEEVLGCQQ